jgi:ubiquinone biosynthesis protein
MERLDGIKVTCASGLDAQRAAVAIAEALIAHPLFAPQPTALFHADPHAGNLLWTTDGRLGLLDWSLVGRLDKRVRVELVQMVLGALTHDAGRVARHMAAVCVSGVDEVALRHVVEEALWDLRQRGRFCLEWLVNLLDHSVIRARARFPDDLLLHRKGLLTLFGVVEHVSPGFDIDGALSRYVARSFITEWPSRWLVHPLSRGLPSHVSNADLWLLSLMAPAAACRVACEQAFGWTVGPGR